MNHHEAILPYGRQSISDEDIASVVDVLKSRFLTQGPTVEAFEKAVAKKVQANHGIAVNSATSALHLACIALDLKAGDYLWTSPSTFVASANCGRYCGANVDFVDIDRETGLLSVKKLAKKLAEAKQNGTLPKVVVPVHLAGASCDMRAIANLAKQYNFSVLEDASHAIGGKYQGKPVGNCIYSDITVFSFHPVKIITTGEGGLTTTNNSALAGRIKSLRSHGITKDETKFLLPSQGPWSYEQQELGFNYRMTDLQAALGLSQLKKLDEIVTERNRQLHIYEEMLCDLPVQLLQVPKEVLSSVHLAVIKLLNTDKEKHRKIFEGMRKERIGVQLHYSPVHLQPYYRKLGFKDGDFPEAEAYGKSAISLPLFPGLKPTDQLKVVSTLKALL